MKNIGGFMKEKREGLGLSLREASKLSGVSHTHIRDIEDGRSVPSFEMVMKFLRAYGVAIEVFLQETGYLSSHGEPEGIGAVRRVPVISWAQAGNWQELCANFQYGGHEEYVEVSVGKPIIISNRTAMFDDLHDSKILIYSFELFP